ncbi:MAG: PilT/PilU family type 4a pilus ATPase [Candidatus Omnitrophica bacterium]|jgi:twitching motility protein PilT|nr:PilT/PilU family type 4a pilus ATPase [Candidatus Omnitrophota bacterium]
MLSYNLINRRKNLRVYTRIPVVYEIKSIQDKTVRKKTGVIKNISADGVCLEIDLEIDEALALNSELSVKFQLPKEDLFIEAVVKINWIRAVTNKRNFYAGGIFTKIGENEEQRILQVIERLNINKILNQVIKAGASDLHLVVDQPPTLRINGELQMMEMAELNPEDIANLVYSLMDEEQIARFEEDKELDFGFQYDMHNRFRVNLHQQRGFMEVTFRLISAKFFSFEELKIPDVTKDLARQKDGLVLVVGPTGSGKTTTIAAMVELINQERKAVVITLERPIEYIHNNVKSIIKQREVGVDTNSFSVALKSSLRQDPNVIVVGEMDDIETVKTALIAAEAGYLVIASFHAPNTIQAIDRMASIFPVENRRQVLAQLANCIRGIIFQLLIPRRDKNGRVLASEVVIGNDAVRTIVRKDELIQLPTIVQTSGMYHMQTMYDSIRKYLNEGIIDEETALLYSEEFSQYRQWLK